MVYTLKSSNNSQVYIYYKDSDLKQDYVKIVDEPFAKINSVKVSASGKVFLVEIEDKIQRIMLSNPKKVNIL